MGSRDDGRKGPTGPLDRDNGDGAGEPAAARRTQPTQAELRTARAAEKLRENLVRRKAQTRARRKGEAETGVGLPAAAAGVDDPGDPASASPAPSGQADDLAKNSGHRSKPLASPDPSGGDDS